MFISVPHTPAREDFESPSGHFRLVLDRTAVPQGRFMISPQFNWIVPGMAAGVTIPDAITACIEALKEARADIDARLAELDAMLKNSDFALNRDK